MRALIGIIMFAQFFVFCFFPEWIIKYISNVEYANVFEGGRSPYFFENKEFAAITSLILLIWGCRIMWKSNLRGSIIRLFAAWPSMSSTSGDFQNIERVKNYRNSAMSLMTSEQAAKEFKQTAWSTQDPR